MTSECDGLFGSILTVAGVVQVRGSGGSPTWLRHGPGLTLHGGAGRRGNPDTGHVGGLDLELVEGALGQTVDLDKTEMSGVFGPCLCVSLCVRVRLTVQILSVTASWLTSFHTRESASRLSM